MFSWVEIWLIKTIFILLKLFTDPLFPMNEGITILEETSPISIEMCHQRINVIIAQNNFIWICSDPSL